MLGAGLGPVVVLFVGCCVMGEMCWELCSMVGVGWSRVQDAAVEQRCVGESMFVVYLVLLSEGKYYVLIVVVGFECF